MRSHCALYVDAGYLLAGAATRLSGTSLRASIHVKHERLIADLIDHVEQRAGLPLLRVHWYDSARRGVPDPVQEQIGLLPRVKLRLGRIGYGGEQKGVDLRIGLDMVAHARNGTVDVLFLVSGDDDLTEAVEDAQAHGVQAIVLAVPDGAGKPHAVSKHLRGAADGMELIDGAVLDSAVFPITPPEPVEPAAAEPASKPEATKVDGPPVPSPALFAHRNAATPPLPPVREPVPVYTSSSGSTSMISAEYRGLPDDAGETIDAVAGRVLASWLKTATESQRAELSAKRPSIPPEIDRTLLIDASAALGVYDLDDGVRYRLRASFWAKVDES